MRDHESAMLAYVRLADLSQRKHQPLGRDKLLVLGAAAACRAGWPEVAERCRRLVLDHNPAHLIGKFATVADALRSEEFGPLLRQHERLCSYERAEFLVGDNVSEPDGQSEPDERTNGQIALDLLASPPTTK